MEKLGSSKEAAGREEGVVDAKLEDEVDRMLREFSKILPGDASTALDSTKPRKPTEQIEATFEKLLEEPVGGAERDVDLGELEDVNSMIEQLMSQLTSKEILYEPFQEIASKYPAWLEQNAAACAAPDLANYRSQLAVAQEVVQIFESPQYKEGDQELHRTLFELMQKLQDLGSTPPGLLSNANDPTEEQPGSATGPPECTQM